MKALRCHSLDGIDALRVDDLPSPSSPGPGKVHLRIRAAGVNFADTLMVAGQYQDKPELPFTAGMEAAAEVVACGEGVAHVKPGDRVFALLGQGAFAEEAVADAMQVAPLPPSMDFVTAAAFPIAYGTSHMALVHRARLQAGESLVVHGASGGVGLTAVEIGKKLGATVIATGGSDEKLEVCREYGADHLINYRREDVRERIKALTDRKGANVVYDPVGGDVFDASLRAIAWEGRLVTIGYASGRIPSIPANLLLVKNCAVMGLYWGRYAQRDPAPLMASLMELFGWYEEGALKPRIGATFPLEQAAEGLRMLVDRKAVGKVVIEIPG